MSISRLKSLAKDCLLYGASGGITASGYAVLRLINMHSVKDPVA